MLDKPNPITGPGHSAMNGGGFFATEANTWPAPDMTLAQREALPPPAWPQHLFPSWWAGYLARVAEARGCPVDFVGLATLAALGTRIGNARWANPWGEWREPPIIWGAAVGLPSSGKSPGLGSAQEAMAAVQKELDADWEERYRDFRTQAAEAAEIRRVWEGEVKAAVKNGVPAPREPQGAREPDAIMPRRTFTTQPTTESATRLCAANPRGLLLFRDELAGWLGDMDRYSGGAGGGDRAFWLQAYGGAHWQPDRVKDGDRPVVVPHLSFGILGGIQPDRLASGMLAGDDDGLAARFLYCWPAARPPVRPDQAPPPPRLEAALRRLEGLQWQGPAPVLMRFTPDAQNALQSWREECAAMEGSASGLFLSWLGKMPGFAVRLAVVFRHMAWLAEADHTAPPEDVDLDAITRACAFLGDYALPMARRVFGEAALPAAERDARRLARWWMKQRPRPGTLNARELRRMADGPGIPTPERVMAALGELEAAGWCRKGTGRQGDNPGRQRADWHMNPAMMEAAP